MVRRSVARSNRAGEGDRCGRIGWRVRDLGLEEAGGGFFFDGPKLIETLIVDVWLMWDATDIWYSKNRIGLGVGLGWDSDGIALIVYMLMCSSAVALAGTFCRHAEPDRVPRVQDRSALPKRCSERVLRSMPRGHQCAASR